jgi:hypothetical protein
MSTRRLAVTIALASTAAIALLAQEPRPANIPFYTWVREDTFAGFIDNDLVRFARGEQKVREYLQERPGRPDATNWLGATKVYRAVRAFEDGDRRAGERLLKEALAAIDQAVAAAAEDPGIRATAGGTLAFLAPRLPDAHYRPMMEKAREHYGVLYRLQAAQAANFPLHLKGELLAGVAETEFRVGDRQRATEMLQRIVTEMPDTAYARTAAAWLASPDTVTIDTRLVCQSCHQPGRLSSWTARQPRR